MSEPDYSSMTSFAQVGIISSVPTTSERRHRWVKRGKSSATFVFSSAVSLLPNQALEPTPLSVTIRADAQLAPAIVVAHL